MNGIQNERGLAHIKKRECASRNMIEHSTHKNGMCVQEYD